MDCRIVLLLVVVVSSCLCLPNPAASGPWTLKPACACGRIYMPVCGSDHQTYNSPCEFECAASFYQYWFGMDNMKIEKHAPCEEQDTSITDKKIH